MDGREQSGEGLEHLGEEKQGHGIVFLGSCWV